MTSFRDSFCCGTPSNDCGVVVRTASSAAPIRTPCFLQKPTSGQPLIVVAHERLASGTKRRLRRSASVQSLRRHCVLPVRAAARDRLGAVVADGAVKPWQLVVV